MVSIIETMGRATCIQTAVIKSKHNRDTKKNARRK